MPADTLRLRRTGTRTHDTPAVTIKCDEDCEWLIDNSAAYDRIIESIIAAKVSIRISQLAFDSDCIAYGSAGSPDLSLAGIVAAAARDRGVDVRILMNQTLLLDTVTPLRKWLASHSAKAVRVRGVSRFPQLLHAKMVVVDDAEVFLVGSPFVNGYWDDSRHAPTDSRRPMRELGGRPLHDVSVRLTGSPVVEAAAMFDEWWKTANGECVEDASPVVVPLVPRVASKTAAVHLTSTCPGSTARRGRKDILAACLDGISRARSLIYIEHQYLSARPVVKALSEALDKNSELELIVVLNQNPDITAYRRWQNDRLAQSGLGDHQRVGVFSLWSATTTKVGRIEAATQIFVHSKVMLVDDQWAMVGSANLDGVSLHSYGDDFAGPVARRVFRNVRNFDVNAIVRDGCDDVPRNGFVASLRSRLWAEHLGMNVRAMAARPAEGWLPLWRNRARDNVLALKSNDSRHRYHGSVLPYSTKPTPATQWLELGISAVAASRLLQFDPGWMEVYLSPNWVRNMWL
ncbi:MAG: phospholipase D-like domain-containing protein [Gemmatimonadales bacterium]